MSNDRDALRELLRISTPGASHVIVHYLYVPSKEVAVGVSSELQQKGFRTENRLGADGTSWLVLARHEVVPDEAVLSENRRLMESLAANVHGEYDGWEAEVHE